MTTHVLKEDLKRFRRYRHTGYAKRLSDGCYQRVMEKGIATLITLANRLQP
jgi:hypothetical protein